MLTPIKYEELQKSYPEAIKTLKDWITLKRQVDIDTLRTNGLDVSNENIEEIQEWKEHFTELMVVYNPRGLFDFFDEQNIKICITLSDSDLWTYWNTSSGYSYTAGSRAEAEQKAFVEAFKLLEESYKLKIV